MSYELVFNHDDWAKTVDAFGRQVRAGGYDIADKDEPRARAAGLMWLGLPDVKEDNPLWPIVHEARERDGLYSGPKTADPSVRDEEEAE